MSATQSAQFSNIAAGSTAAFSLKGGQYAVLTKSTGSGTIDLKLLAFDGRTWMPIIPQITATTGFANSYLPPGQYQVVISGFTANYVSITSIIQHGADGKRLSMQN